jgi:hypothetical protein
MARKKSPSLSWSERLRWRFAALLMPRLYLAEERQRLERIAREVCASRSEAKAIASRYFSEIR